MSTCEIRNGELQCFGGGGWSHYGAYNNYETANALAGGFFGGTVRGFLERSQGEQVLADDRLWLVVYFRFTSVFSGFSGGGRGGGDRITSQSPLAQDNSQQGEFDNCVRNAIRTWRRAEYPAITKIVAGAAIGTASTIYGVNASIRIGSIVTSGVKILAWKTGGRLLWGAAAGSGTVGYFTGDAVVSGFRDSAQNAATKDAAIADCKKEFPNANQGALHIAGIAARTW